MKHDQDLDQSLLMLSVGELSGSQKLAVEAHLLLCKSCQARMTALGKTSTQIAGAFGVTKSASLLPAILRQIQVKLAIYTVVVVTAAMVTIGVVSAQNQSKVQSVTPQVHCRPGIVSDQCR